MLIDRTYFVGELNIPNSEQPVVESRLNSFIAKYETKFLCDVLGNGLYKLFRTGLTLDPIDARWLNLKNGVDDWNGLIYTEGGYKRSPIANFVYFHWMRDALTQSTGSGEMRPTIEGGSKTSINWKQVTAWNDMCEQVESLYTFLSSDLVTYPEYENLDFAKIREYIKINHLGI